MNLEEWTDVLTAIQNDETLMNMKISNVYDSDSSANPDKPSQGSNFRAACFSNDEETVIVFRGTHGAYTWNDNGEGGYQATTHSQKEALNYVNLLGANLTTSGKITVTGHSKGGNLAQYVTICAANLTIDRCVSFDGQGFSNEFLDEYKQKLQLNQDKLYSVNSAGDFVNPLLNTIVPESHRMYVESNPVDGLMEYHKPNNVFKGTTIGLNAITFPSFTTQLINDMTCFIINYPTDIEHTEQQRSNMIDTLVGFLEGDAYYDDEKISYKELIDNKKNLLLAAIDLTIITKTDNKVNLHILENYKKGIQDDAHLDRIYDAIKMLAFYLEKYIENGITERRRVLCAVDEILEDKFIIKTIFYYIMSEISTDQYYDTVEEIENEIHTWQEIFAINHQYAQSNHAGELWDNDTSQKIISAKYYEDDTVEYTWLEAGANASGGDGDDAFIGNFKDNILYGNKGNDTLFGGNGDDKLYGGAGDDILIGGKGNDYLRGGSGVDIYTIESHDGIDIIDNYWGDDLTIKEHAEEDVLYFGVNVYAKDIQFSRGKYPNNGNEEEYDLYVYYHGFEDDQNYVIVKNFFYVNDQGQYPSLFKHIKIEEQPKVFQYISMEEVFRRVGLLEMYQKYNSNSTSNSSTSNPTGNNSSTPSSSGNNNTSGNNQTGTGSSSNNTSGNNRFGNDIPGNIEHSIGNDNPSGNNSSDKTNGSQEGISPPPIPDGNGDDGSGSSANPGGGNGGSGSGNGGGNGGSGSGNGDSNGGSGSGNGGSNGGSGSGNGNGGGNGSGSGGRDVRDNYRRYVGVAPVDMEKAENVRASTDPIIIDLNQDGIYTQSIHEGAHFDFAGDGYREGTGWIAPQDGMLVHDVNGDGIINDGTELFGDRTVLGDGSIAERGFVALKDIDSNKDGKLNREDDVFSELNVWVDHNGNGASEEGELYTLDEIGISEIHLNETYANYTDANGNRIMAVGSVQRADGTLNHFAEVIFKVDTTATIQVSDAPIDETIKETMPELYPSGMLLTLQQAMTADEVLYQNVKAYMDATTGKQKLDCLEQLILRWAHADTIPAGSRRGNDMDAAHLAVLEAFYGKPFAGRADSTPNYNAAILLNEIYDKLLCDIDMELMVQTSLSPYLDMIMVQEKEDGTLHIDFDTGLMAIRNSQYEENIKQELMAAYIRAVNTVPKYKSSVSEWTTKLQSDSYYAPALLMVQDHNWMTAEQMINRRRGNAGNNVIYGSDNAEIIDTGMGNDVIITGAGDDNITAGEGNDILNGGTGNDRLRGGNGEDIYILNLGDGEDIIYNYDTTSTRIHDRIVFGEGILPEHIKLTRQDRNLIIQYSDNDKVTIDYFFQGKDYVLEHIIFADGTEWTLKDIEKKLQIIQGTAQTDNLKGNISTYGYNDSETFFGGNGNDYIYGYAGDDTLFGEAGDDNLNGGEGNDILRGGTGNDRLRGDAGADTYIFNLGDGEDIIVNYDNTSTRLQDKLVFGEGILPEHIKLTRKNYNLIIQYSDNDKVTIEYFFQYKEYALEHIVFTDGTEWTLTDITEKLQTIQGTAQSDNLKGNIAAYGYSDSETFLGGDGNDYIYGEAGDDTLYGEAGDDNLNGGEGNDILNGGTGNDRLRGDNGADTYILNLGDGEDIIVNYDNTSTRLQDKLVFGEGILPEHVKLTRKDRSLIIQYSENDKVIIDSFFYNKDSALEHIIFADGTEWTLADITERLRTIQGTEQSDNLKGNITAYGYDDSEIFFGGDSNDYIYGYAGDDILHGEAGNDTLNGGEGNDMLNGGTGNDNLRGETGDDIYFFSYGCGYDTITNADNNETSIDTILFGNDVSPDDISVAKNNYDLILFIGQHDAIRVSNYYKDAGSRIDQIAFADGTLYHADTIEALVSQREKEAVSITNANTSAVDTDVMNRMNLLIQTMNSMQQDDGTMITGQPEQTGSNIPDNLLCFFKSN
ncbi:MAG: DUF2974 domain-containing protein [Lachnospira sp.]|nr:DUF2974 domain-containing protein [Lachnospira sp.]